MAKQGTKRTSKQPQGSVTLAQWMARGLSIAYAGPDSTPEERHRANLRYGNELAAREMDFIRQHTAPEHHARLSALRASRMRRDANKQAKTEIRSPFGRHIDTDYVEQLRQGAFAIRLEAYALRQEASPNPCGA